MSTLNVLVRKFRNAVTGAQDPVVPSAPRLFNWEAFPPLPAGSSDATGDAVSVAPPPASQSRTPRPEQPSTIIGSAIPADVSDFAVVYRGAGIAEPSHGYGVDRVEQMLNHKSFAGLDRSVKAKAVLAALDAAGVAIQDVIHDAVLRFKTLIAFEAVKDLETSATGPHEARIAQLESEIEAFREEKSAAIRALMRETNSAVQALVRLRMRASAEQDRYYRAVSLFVESLPAPVIPIGSARPEGAPETVLPELKLVASENLAEAHVSAAMVHVQERGQAVLAVAESSPGIPADAVPSGEAKAGAEPKAK